MRSHEEFLTQMLLKEGIDCPAFPESHKHEQREEFEDCLASSVRTLWERSFPVREAWEQHLQQHCVPHVRWGDPDYPAFRRIVGDLALTLCEDRHEFRERVKKHAARVAQIVCEYIHKRGVTPIRDSS